jgi:hypothetical protein
MRTAVLLRPTWALLVTLAACASGAKPSADASDTPGSGGASGNSGGSGGSGGKGGAWPEDPDGPPGGWAGGTAGSSTGGTGGAGSGGSSAGGSGGAWSGGTAGSWSGGAAGFTGGSGGSSGDAGVDAPPAVGSDNCTSAPQIKLEGSGRIRLRANTTTAARELDPPCAVGSGGPDVFFRLAVDRRSLVYVDTFGANANTVVFFASTCSGGMAGGAQSCSDDACGVPQSQAVADLPNGAHYLVVSGKAGATFDTMINLEYTVVSNTMVQPLPAGPSTLTGTTTGVGNIYVCEASGPEASYWWLTCPSFTEMPVMSSTCTGTAFDTVLSFQAPRTGLVACSNDSCGFQAALSGPVPAGAGLNVLSVTGPTLQNKGAFTLQVNRP